jgi:DNA-binding response OmpR family regulator
MCPHIVAQMPIVDGLTSTKMIRSFEKTHTNIYSPRAALNGRVPIIAVSASLLEKSRQGYIDAGFDAWILKPISFVRLKELMAAIVETKTREECLYQPGEWEKGGWFHMGQKSSLEADTRPSGEPPQTNPSESARRAAASPDDAMAGDEQGEIPDEQARLLHTQEKGKGKHVHYEATPEASPNPPATDT